MIRYIDRQLVADTSRTRRRLGWAPRPRLEVLRRLPLLVENLRLDPLEWHARNRAALESVPVRPNLVVYRELERRVPDLRREFAARLAVGGRGPGARFPGYGALESGELEWHVRLIVRELMNAVRTRDRTLFLDYCKSLAVRRLRLGFPADEVCRALAELSEVCASHVGPVCRAKGLGREFEGLVTLTLDLGADHVLEVYERG